MISYFRIEILTIHTQRKKRKEEKKKRWVVSIIWKQNQWSISSNNYIDTDSPTQIIPSLDRVPIRLNSEFQVLGIRRSRAGCSWICNSLSRKKTEATCFLFLFTLSGPPPFFLSSFFSVFFFLFPRRTGRKIEQPRGREKKEQMNRSRMESRCSSSWFTAVEFNPCRQITIVISNYNSVTGRTVTVRWRGRARWKFQTASADLSPLLLSAYFQLFSLFLVLLPSLAFAIRGVVREKRRRIVTARIEWPCVESIRRRCTCGVLVTNC